MTTYLDFLNDSPFAAQFQVLDGGVPAGEIVIAGSSVSDVIRKECVFRAAGISLKLGWTASDLLPEHRRVADDTERWLRELG